MTTPTITMMTGSAAFVGVEEASFLFDDSDGFYSVLSNFESVDENGFYNDPKGIFTYLIMDSQLLDLSSQQMGILLEIYPYRWGGFDESNTDVKLLACVYNGLTDPEITMEPHWFVGSNYSVSISTSEIGGLQEKFGFTTISPEDQLESTIRTMTSEVYNSYIAKRASLKKGPRPKLVPNNFAFLKPFSVTQSNITGSSDTGATTTAAATTTTTVGSGGY
jgi:hypothetical protein|tara:strand:+ start:1423 stop:2082 length:660 start_codon:yes stop_codon:yes gene_type:complete